jgi:predicted dehydrogenase
VRRLGELARSGALGAVTGLRTTRVAWGQPHIDVDCTWILAPHDLSIALEILGEVPSPASAVVDDPHRVELMVGFGRTSAGVWHHLEVSTRSTATERRIEVIGTEAAATLAGGWDDV